MQSLSHKFITKHQWLVHSLYWQKYWDTPFFRREKCTSKLWQQNGNIIQVLKNCISTSVGTVLKCMKWLYPYVHSVCFWLKNFKSAFKVTPEVSLGLWLSADQSSSSTLTESFLFDPCLIHKITCKVRIEKSPVQTFAIKLEARNSLEYHYMLKH